MANTRTARARSKAGKARGGSSRTPTIAAVVVLVILIVGVGVGLYVTQQKNANAPAPPIPVSQALATFPTTVQGGVIQAGNGPKVIDVYEDAQCPACKQFEDQYGQQVIDGLNTNKLTVKYHMVNLLDRSSNPPGYSTLGGNAIICAAENNAFANVHKTLYDQQPEEGGNGYKVDQLVGIGPGAGAGPGYASCVQQGTHANEVAANFAQATSNPGLKQPDSGGFATPTIVFQGKVIVPGTPALTQALS